MREHYQELIEAVNALAGQPGKAQLRRRLCDAFTQCFLSFVSWEAQRRMPWNNQSTLEEILQRFFSAVLPKVIRLCETQRIESDRPAQQIVAYFRKIARRELQDQLGRYLSQHKIGKPLALGDSQVAVYDPPVEQLIKGELQDNVRRALERLSPGDQVIIKMFFFEGLPHRRIAARLKISQEAARTRLHRATQRLKAMLEP